MRLRLNCQSCHHDVEREPSQVHVECGVLRDNVVFTCPRSGCGGRSFRHVSAAELLVLAATGVVVPPERLSRAARDVLGAHPAGAGGDHRAPELFAGLDSVDTVEDLLEIWDR